MIELLPEDDRDYILNSKVVSLSFSRGKDSIACALILRELGVKFHPYFFFHIPDLNFVNESLKYYEDYFNTEIRVYPHPMFFDYIRHQDYMPKDMATYMYEINIPKIELSKIKICDLLTYYNYSREDLKSYANVTGVTAAESFNRALMFRRQKVKYVDGMVYPLQYYKSKDVYDLINKYDVKLPIDYDVANRSFDGLSYKFLKPIFEKLPKEYEKIKYYFPLVDLNILKYEQNKKHFPKK